MGSALSLYPFWYKALVENKARQDSEFLLKRIMPNFLSNMVAMTPVTPVTTSVSTLLTAAKNGDSGLKRNNNEIRSLKLLISHFYLGF